MQAITEDGRSRFNLVRQRNGTKFVVKKIKVEKDYSFRDEMASLVLKVNFRVHYNYSVDNLSSKKKGEKVGGGNK